MAVKKQTTNTAGRVGRGAKWRVGTGIALAVMSVYALISIVSYFFYWDVDHSVSGVPLAAGDGAYARNLGGKLGNYLAEVFVRRWFGVAALCIPAAAFVVALRLLRIGRLRTVRLLTILLLLMLLVSLSFGVGSSRMLLGAGLGGEYGYFIGRVWLIATLGKFGSVMLLTVAFFLLCSYAIPRFPQRVKAWGLRMAACFGKKKEGSATANASTGDSDNAVEESSEEKQKHGDERGGEHEDESGDDVGITFEPDAAVGIKLIITPPEDDCVEDDRSFVGNRSGVEEEEEKKKKEEDEESAAVDDEEGLTLQVDGEGSEQQLSEVLASRLPYDPKADLSRYEHPPVELLNDYPKSVRSVSAEELEQNKDKIVRTLGHYNISISEIRATIGPTVTLYEIIPAPGVRI
ncbi:MAG: DNA translocase FtsK 4TM domain-containing protein, partial [Prevotellaceae bacterium]|nr:DNA translocase FtsK 4TM domain-containing protein [Prevotellaceae bacterium]